MNALPQKPVKQNNDPFSNIPIQPTSTWPSNNQQVPSSNTSQNNIPNSSSFGSWSSSTTPAQSVAWSTNQNPNAYPPKNDGFGNLPLANTNTSSWSNNTSSSTTTTGSNQQSKDPFAGIPQAKSNLTPRLDPFGSLPVHSSGATTSTNLPRTTTNDPFSGLPPSKPSNPHQISPMKSDPFSGMPVSNSTNTSPRMSTIPIPTNDPFAGLPPAKPSTSTQSPAKFDPFNKIPPESKPSPQSTVGSSTSSGFDAFGISKPSTSTTTSTTVTPNKNDGFSSFGSNTTNTNTMNRNDPFAPIPNAIFSPPPAAPIQQQQSVPSNNPTNPFGTNTTNTTNTSTIPKPATSSATPSPDKKIVPLLAPPSMPTRQLSKLGITQSMTNTGGTSSVPNSARGLGSRSTSPERTTTSTSTPTSSTTNTAFFDNRNSTDMIGSRNIEPSRSPLTLVSDHNNTNNNMITHIPVLPLPLPVNQISPSKNPFESDAEVEAAASVTIETSKPVLPPISQPVSVIIENTPAPVVTITVKPINIAKISDKDKSTGPTPSDTPTNTNNKKFNLGFGGASNITNTNSTNRKGGYINQANLFWRKPYYLDCLLDGCVDVETIPPSPNAVAAGTPNVALEAMKQSIKYAREALFRYHSTDKLLSENERKVILKIIDALDKSNVVFERLPVKSNDIDRIQPFLDGLMHSIKEVHETCAMVMPLVWTGENDLEYCCLITIYRVNVNTYNIGIINTNKGSSGGLDYHPITIDNSTGAFLRSVTLDMLNVPAQKVYNTSFWLTVFKASIFPSWKVGIRYLYEKVIPFLSSKPITAAIDLYNIEFIEPPYGTDRSGINSVLECIRYLGRIIGGTTFKESYVYPMLVKWDMLLNIKKDLELEPDIPEIELDALTVAVGNIARVAGLDMSSSDIDTTGTTITTTNNTNTTNGNKSGMNKLPAESLQSILTLVDDCKSLLKGLDSRCTTPPIFQLQQETKFHSICENPWYGRLRRDSPVDYLAGDAPRPPIMRPIELTLVPEVATGFLDVTKAMRHALHLCILLANQREYVRNSFTLRLCLIEHLFVRVIPLPLALLHPQRDTRCFWHSTPMRRETQNDLLHLLNLLSRHFAAASLSVKTTRSGDAIRMLVFSCMATIGDAILRKIASDIPSYTSLHYAGKGLGPISPFGFDIGNFAEESEYLKLTCPETTAARTQVLDYFYDMKKVVSDDHMLFKFDYTSEITTADKLFIDQIAINLGFKRFQEIQYMTGVNSLILDHFPEIGFFRDLIFMFKLVMVPTSDKLPELKPWEPEEVGLKWSIDDKKEYVVKGFNMRLECIQDHTSTQAAAVAQTDKERKKSTMNRIMKFVGLGPKKLRALPSQANPTVIVGERIENEDDVLHIRDLPTFDNTLGARDCELLLQYLTAPYIRIPLLLNFFSVESRLQALRNTELQEVLDAAIFEPGQFKPNDDKLEIPLNVPAVNRNHLFTTTGLLFNEIIMSPQVILTSIQSMLEKVIDMDTGRYSELSASILYVVRLAVRVEGFLLFLVKNRNFQLAQKDTADGPMQLNGAYQKADVRGLECNEETLQEALTCQKNLRSFLDSKVFIIIARWINKSKKEGLVPQACMLHAHLAYIYKDIEYEELNPKIVFTILASQIYLQNNFKYDIDVSVEDTPRKNRKEADQEVSADLVIPQVELFDMFQRNRSKILLWLNANGNHCNTVMDGIVQMVEDDLHGMEASDVVIAQQWKTIDLKLKTQSFSFAGRFMPVKEVDEKYIEKQLTAKEGQTYEEWWIQVSSTLIQTEVNIQLGEFTIKKNPIQQLPELFRQFQEFDLVFGHMRKKIMQCAVIEKRVNRLWVRLTGMGYDLQAWNTDNRVPVHPFNRPLFRTKEDRNFIRDMLKSDSESIWVKDILEPWREKLFSFTTLMVDPQFVETDETVVVIGFFYPNAELQSQGQLNPQSTQVVSPEHNQTYIMREIVVYKYPKVFHVFNIIEYGRRFYRSQIFSSDPMFCYHDMKMNIAMLGERAVEVYGSTKFPDPIPAPSLVINRFALNHEKSTIKQTFIPNRLLYGLMPDCILQNYSFWQNEDDSLTGYMPLSKKSSARSILNIVLHKRGNDIDNMGFGANGANAMISRLFIADDHVTPDLDPEIAAFNTTPDATKPELYLINLVSVMSSFLTQASDHSIERLNHSLQASKSLIEFPKESFTIHALLRQILQLDGLSNILAWSKVKPVMVKEKQSFFGNKPAQKIIEEQDKLLPGANGVSIDIIELPRLRLTFEKRIIGSGSDQKIIYTCLEQSGLFITGYDEHLTFGSLLQGIPRQILLRNSDQEYFVLIPAIAKPALLSSKGAIKQYVFTTSLSNQEWINNTGESTYFVYPIHASGCFMASRSIASSLYLLVVRLMTRKYEEAFHLLEGCVSDVLYTKQEQQIYDQITSVKDDVNIDLHAFRLKLFALTYGCADVMSYPFNPEEEILTYITKLKFVSSRCRLSPEEEYFILSTIPSTSELKKNLAIINRENLIKVMFDLSNNNKDKSFIKNPKRNFPVMYPTIPDFKDPNFDQIDVKLLDTDGPIALANLKRIWAPSYTKPETAVGINVVKQVLKIIDNAPAAPNPLLLFELMANHLTLQILPSDTTHDLGSFLFFLLGQDKITGVQNVILHVMSHIPQTASAMPPFKDERRLKLPKFTGLDVYQAHVKSSAQYIQENCKMGEIVNIHTVFPQFKPKELMQAAPRIETSYDHSDGRFWLVPTVRDFKGTKRHVSHNHIPSGLNAVNTYLTTKEITFLVGTPLHSIDLRNYIDLKDLASRKYEQVDPKFPIHVLNHPSSRSYIARVSVTRLEQDLKDFASEENVLKTPVLKFVNNTINWDYPDATKNIDSAVNAVASLVANLETLRDNDNTVVKLGIEEIVNYCNGSFLTSVGDIRALRHNLLQRAKTESSLVSLIYI